MVERMPPSVAARVSVSLRQNGEMIYEEFQSEPQALKFVRRRIKRDGPYLIHRVNNTDGCGDGTVHTMIFLMRENGDKHVPSRRRLKLVHSV